MKSELQAAFDATCRGFSADRVICDPDINREFLTECRRLGIELEDAALNAALINLRKTSGLKSRTKTIGTSFRNEHEYRFAAEMAARHLERREGISLDVILCDPGKALEFDELARSILPGYSALQYRWAAINLRKARQLKPEVIAQALPSKEVTMIRVDSIDMSAVPTEQGMYLFSMPAQVLYVGEAENLRVRIKKHLDHSDNKGLAQWMWQHGTDGLHLELHVLDSSTKAAVRRALEAELIDTRRPAFNIQRRFHRE